MDKILDSKIRETIKSKFENISEKDLNTAVSEVSKKLQPKINKVDEEGNIIVAENVKIVLNSSISSITE